MKQNSANKAILAALIAGEKITVMEGAKKFGTNRVPNRCLEFEEKYGITLNRKWVIGKNRYGKPTKCYAYSMRREDAKRVKKLLQVKK